MLQSELRKSTTVKESLKMDLILQIVSAVAGLVSLVCFVLVVVKMFQNKQTGLGVASIIGLFCIFGYFIALFVGWKNRAAWQLEKVMPVFTIAFLLSLVLTAYTVVGAVQQGLQEVQTPNSEFESDLEVPEISP
jgi:Ca2+/Na+ antiporter